MKALHCLAPANTLKITTIKIELAFSGEGGQFDFRSNYDWLFGSAVFCVPLFFLAIVSGKDPAGNIAGTIKFYGTGTVGNGCKDDCGAGKVRS